MNTSTHNHLPRAAGQAAQFSDEPQAPYNAGADVQPPAKKVFHLSPAELAKIDRNIARIAQFADPGTAAMF